MQEYKIKIPNQEISEAVQRKAFELGYKWDGTDEYINDYPDLKYLFFDTDTIITWAESLLTWDNPEYTNKEILYQDFLKLGDVDVNNCKIVLPMEIASRNELSKKLNDLGIIGYGKGNPPIIRALGWPISADIENGLSQFIYIEDGKSVMIGTESYFNYINLPILTVEQIININNNIMPDQNEIELTLVKQPKSARNLTVGNVYKGIFVDADDTQVDTFNEAEYFLCENNSNKEARYSIGLFAKPEPVRPKVTYEEVVESLKVHDRYVSCNLLDKDIIEYGYESHISIDQSTISCGITQLSEVNELYYRIKSELESKKFDFDFNIDDFISVLFIKIITAVIEETNGKFCLISTTIAENKICDCINKIMAAQGGVSRDGSNPNSGNDIRLWVIDK